jgi:hypothetical protein
MWEVLFRILAGTSAITSEVFRDFLQSFQIYVWIEPRLGYDRFLPYTFQIIFHVSSHKPTLYNLDNGKVSLNKDGENIKALTDSTNATITSSKFQMFVLFI